MKSIHTKFYLLMLFALVIMVSCSDDDENPMVIEMDDDDEETITQVDLTFTPQGELQDGLMQMVMVREPQLSMI